jgi:hypothetical protein
MPDEETFKVTDRRGRSREATGPEPAGASAPTVESPPEASPRTLAAEPGGRPEKPDLQGLFIMFASSALIHLGDAPDPVTGELRVDLAHAQQAIDVLLLLREKTQGNRTDQESRVLEQIVYDLQMRFVEATRGR